MRQRLSLIHIFSDTYGPVAEKMRALLDYAEKNPYAYGYNDACTAFARGESAMYPIGSYAIPQIKSVNPDMNIGSFTFPANAVSYTHLIMRMKMFHRYLKWNSYRVTQASNHLISI